MTVKRTHYDNGQIAHEYHFKNDQLHGRSRQWYTNGQLVYEYHFKEDQRHGRCRQWYPSGVLNYEVYHRNDVAITIPEGTIAVEP